MNAGAQRFVADSTILFSAEGVDSDGLKKFLGLPIKKPLVYYTSRWDRLSRRDVKRLGVDEVFVSEVGFWCSLKIETDDGEIHRIHSGYFKQMQSPSFIEDMEKTDRGLYDLEV